MSFIHNMSCECLKTELELFSLPPTQTSIERGEWVPYKPVASVTDDSPIEFSIPAAGDHYIDLPNTMLHAVVSITNETGAAILAATNVAPVNNFLHSMFSQVDVFLNSKMVSQPDHLYPFRAYIENLLNYNDNAKSTHLTQCLYYPDTYAKFNTSGDDNIGYKTRAEIAKASAKFDMLGRLHSDIFASEKFLLNGVELRLKLHRSKPKFNLMYKEENTNFKVKIHDITLLVRKMTISPTILLAHAKALESNTAKYPISRVNVKSITISKDISSKSIDNLFLGQIPRRIIIGLVSNTALNGAYKLNPFNFNHFNMNYMSLYLDGRQIPCKPLQPEIDKSMYIQNYNTLFTGTGINFNNDGCSISRSTYTDGNFLTVFDLTPDLSASSNHWNLNQQGSLRLEIKFASALTETVSVIVYSEFCNVLECDNFRNIILDYSN